MVEENEHLVEKAFSRIGLTFNVVRMFWDALANGCIL